MFTELDIILPDLVGQSYIFLKQYMTCTKSATDSVVLMLIVYSYFFRLCSEANGWSGVSSHEFKSYKESKDALQTVFASTPNNQKNKIMFTSRLLFFIIIISFIF